MSNLSITTRFIQQLSKNGDSVVPIAVKDTLSNCAITYIYDKKASKEDGKERAIEEFGTEALWIGGIPLLKKLYNSTVYKFFKADPKFDIRNLKKDAGGKFERLETLVNITKDASQKQTLENILKNENIQKLYKKLHVSRFLVTTGIPLAALAGLIVYKQKTTEKDLQQKLKQRMELKHTIENEMSKSTTFSQFGNKNSNDISFKGSIGEFLSSYMYNPVKNMQILDGGITSTRLGFSRKGERFEVGFKEFFQIILIYFLAEPIQKGLEHLANKIFKTPVENQYSLLSSENLKELLNTQGLKASIDELLATKEPSEVLNYVFKNEDSALVKMLKISGELPTLKGKDVIDSLGYIDTEEIKGAAKNIDKLLSGMLNASNADKFLSKTKNVKAAAVIANILIGAAAIGIFQPLANILIRKKKNNGDSSNPAIKNLESEMEQKFALK